MCRLTLSSAMQSHDFHSQTVVTATLWRGDYSCTTLAQPDVGPIRNDHRFQELAGEKKP